MAIVPPPPTLSTIGGQPLDSDLTAVAAVVTTTFGRALLALADAAAARTAVGAVIGTDVQAHDAELDALAGLVSAADKVPYFTGSGAAALASLTAFARTILAAVDAAAARTVIGAGTISTQDASNVAITGGAISGITALPVASGGTGSATAAAARTALGVAIGSNVQAWDADLDAVAAIVTTALGRSILAAVVAGAYTQTYSTADKTHAARTASAVATTTATQVTPWGYGSAAQANDIITEINALRVDQLDTAQALNSVIDDLQALGLVG